VNNINDQIDATITILLVFESDCVRCEGCCSTQHLSHRTHSLRLRTPDLQPTTTLGQYTTLL